MEKRQKVFEKITGWFVKNMGSIRKLRVELATLVLEMHDKADECILAIKKKLLNYQIFNGGGPSAFDYDIADGLSAEEMDGLTEFMKSKTLELVLEEQFRDNIKKILGETIPNEQKVDKIMTELC